MPPKPVIERNLPMTLGFAGFAIAALTAVWYRHHSNAPIRPRSQIQPITVIPLAPTPPPVPQDVPPEPPSMALPEPEPRPEPPVKEDTPPSPDLGVDAEGTGHGDGFGLLGKKGGTGLIGGGNGNATIWFGQRITQSLEDQLQSLLTGTSARTERYTVTVAVWLNPAGGLERAELAEGSGDADVDRALRTALPKLHPVPPGPLPENLPQPLRLRLQTRL